MLHPYGLGWLLPSTEIPRGKMMPWLRSEPCMLLWGAKMSTGPGPEVASSSPWQAPVCPGAHGVLLWSWLTPQLWHHWQWGQQPPTLPGCCRWADACSTAGVTLDQENVLQQHLYYLVNGEAWNQVRSPGFASLKLQHTMILKIFRYIQDYSN